MSKIIDKFKILTYNVGIIKKDINAVLENGIGSGDIIWMKHKYKDRFFADPFLFREGKNDYYILAEELSFWDDKGKIVLLTVRKSDFTLIRRELLIEEPYHLSFPFCELNGNTIITESCHAGKTYKYTIDFKSRKILDKHLIIDEGLIDAAFYTDDDGTEWVLASKNPRPKEELYIYKKSNEEFKSINDNKPVLTSIEVTRSAGRLFRVGDKLYRPVQDSTGRYGRQTKIVKVIRLDENGYAAENVCTINSFENPPFDETMHTFNAYNRFVIVDGSHDYVMPMKLLYKKARWLHRIMFARSGD